MPVEHRSVTLDGGSWKKFEGGDGGYFSPPRSRTRVRRSPPPTARGHAKIDAVDPSKISDDAPRCTKLDYGRARS